MVPETSPGIPETTPPPGAPQGGFLEPSPETTSDYGIPQSSATGGHLTLGDGEIPPSPTPDPTVVIASNGEASTLSSGGIATDANGAPLPILTSVNGQTLAVTPVVTVVNGKTYTPTPYITVMDGQTYTRIPPPESFTASSSSNRV